MIKTSKQLTYFRWQWPRLDFVDIKNSLELVDILLAGTILDIASSSIYLIFMYFQCVDIIMDKLYLKYGLWMCSLEQKWWKSWFWCM